MNEVGEAVLRAFISRNLGALRTLGGLPAGLPLAEVTALLRADPEMIVRWFLGDPPRESFWCPAFGVDGFDDRVKIWFRDGVVVKLEGERPDLDVADLEPLGPPELRAPGPATGPAGDGVEQVWPSVGIGVTTNRSGTRIAALSVYAPTTPQRYRETLSEVHEYREFPSRRHD